VACVAPVVAFCYGSPRKLIEAEREMIFPTWAILSFAFTCVWRQGPLQGMGWFNDTSRILFHISVSHPITVQLYLWVISSLCERDSMQLPKPGWCRSIPQCDHLMQSRDWETQDVQAPAGRMQHTVLEQTFP
jgi:hypothetical protein